MDGATGSPAAALFFAAISLVACSSSDQPAEPITAPAPTDAASEQPAPAAPETLSATGLYADFASRSIAEGVEPFEPAYKLWSDAAEKSRWVRLPVGSKIDTTDMDHWSFPVGTRFWKEFRDDGAPVETRMIDRYGPGPADFSYATYAWSSDGSDAHRLEIGQKNANGTIHDIPDVGACKGCHDGLREHILGFGALQLSHTLPGLTLAQLSASGRLTTTPPAAIAPPGDEVSRAALGYLHANCSNCHNTDRGVKFKTPYDLRLRVSDTAVDQTAAWKTAVGVPVDTYSHVGITHRIAPGNPQASCIWYRMSVRGVPNQMPPLATKVVDDTGLAALGAWITGLKP